MALYGRGSTREQKDHGTSLDSQIEAIRSWAEENGYEPAYLTELERIVKRA